MGKQSFVYERNDKHYRADTMLDSVFEIRASGELDKCGDDDQTGWQIKIERDCQFCRDNVIHTEQLHEEEVARNRGE